jgi:excisionase family DNA binding protein
MPERDWFTIKEAATVVGVSKDTLRRYLKMRKNKPPSYRLFPKGRLRFPKEALIRYANGGLHKEE